MIKVLIAEDDSFSNMVLQRVLKKWGFEPVPFEEGRGALEALLAMDGPPVALLDWYLPEMDGIDICARVRDSVVSGCRFLIMLTANTDPAAKDQALETGADVFLSKPIDFDRLFQHLQVAQRRMGEGR